jgi:hypothetical protein
MCRRLLSVLFLSLLITTADAQQPLVNVRGQVLRNGFPALGIQLTLYSQAIGRSALTYSGGDGMYYFYNVPQGQYTVEVWSFNQPQPIYSIQVFSPYTDIPRISVP